MNYSFKALPSFAGLSEASSKAFSRLESNLRGEQ